MSFFNKITTSLYGRRFGLQLLTTPESGSAAGPIDFLVGAEALRAGVTSADTTGTNLKPFGISNLQGTSALSSSVYVLDPPIPGVSKFLVMGASANAPIYVRTANSETIQTTINSSATTLKSTLGTGIAHLVGVTTAIWAALGITSGTSSNAGGFAMATST